MENGNMNLSVPDNLPVKKRSLPRTLHAESMQGINSNQAESAPMTSIKKELESANSASDTMPESAPMTSIKKEPESANSASDAMPESANGASDAVSEKPFTAVIDGTIDGGYTLSAQIDGRVWRGIVFHTRANSIAVQTNSENGEGLDHLRLIAKSNGKHSSKKGN